MITRSGCDTSRANDNIAGTMATARADGVCPMLARPPEVPVWRAFPCRSAGVAGGKLESVKRETALRFVVKGIG